MNQRQLLVWPKFRLSSLFLFLVVLCLIVGRLGMAVRVSANEQKLLQELRELGLKVDVVYWHQLDAASFDGANRKPSPIPSWLKTIFGDMVFTKAYGICVEGDVQCLSTLGLERLKFLRSVSIDSSILTNIDGIRKLESVRNVSFFCESENLKSLLAFSGLPLEEISIWGCNGLSDVSSLRELSSLGKLSIQHCENIENLNLQHLSGSKIRDITLQNCNKVVSVQGLPNDLVELYLADCLSLKYLNGVRELQSLKYLDLDGCVSIPKSELEGLSHIETVYLPGGLRQEKDRGIGDGGASETGPTND